MTGPPFDSLLILTPPSQGSGVGAPREGQGGADGVGQKPLRHSGAQRGRAAVGLQVRGCLGFLVGFIAGFGPALPQTVACSASRRRADSGTVLLFTPLPAKLYKLHTKGQPKEVCANPCAKAV